MSMSNLFKWYAISKKYVEYLRRFDNKVQYIDYGKNFKPFIGIILNISNFDYYVPISSVGNKKAKNQKYLNMKDNIDIYKVYDKGKLLAILNINNMIPINKESVELIKYNDISNYRNFKSVNDEKKYVYLLQRELSTIRKDTISIMGKANQLYNTKFQNPKSNISSRTCEFGLLEEKCIEYSRVQDILDKVKFIHNEEDLYYIYDKLDNKSLFEECVKIIDKPELIDKIQTLDISKFEEAIAELEE